MRPRKIAKYGNADIIRLKPKDLKDLGWDYDDEVDMFYLWFGGNKTTVL